MYQRSYLFLLICISILSAGAVDLMDKTSGVQNIAMGSAGVAQVKGLYSPYWNPAGLYYVERNAVGFNYYRDLGLIDHTSLDGIFLLPNNQRLGLNYTQATLQEIPLTTEQAGEGVKTDDFTDSYRFINFGTAYRLSPSSAVGLSFKTLSRDIYTYTANGYGVDLGYLQKIDSRSTLGINAKNLLSAISWSTGTIESLERKLTTGISITDSLFERPFIINADYDIPLDENASAWYIGAESWIYESFAFRLGTNANQDLTFGLGINYYDLQTDFAYIIKDPESKLDSTFLFSTKIDFRIERLNKTEKKETIAEFNAKITTDNNLVTLDFPTAEFNKFAVIDPNKNVTYYEITPSQNHSFAYEQSGEYTIFFQKHDGTVIKQRINLQ